MNISTNCFKCGVPVETNDEAPQGVYWTCEDCWKIIHPGKVYTGDGEKGVV
jgi:hypothetical protein